MKWNEESCMRGQQTCPLTIHFKMWIVSSDVTIQRRHWQALSVHLWAYCTQPTHDVNDMMSEIWTQRRGLHPLLFSNSDVGSFYVPQEPDKCKCCETGPTVFRPYPRRLESLTVCRCHYKGSTFFSVMLKTLRVGRPGFAPVTSRSADRRFPNRANQIEIGKRLSIIHKYFFYTWLHLLSVAGAKQINEKGVLQANSIYDRKFKWSKPLLVKS